MRKFFGKNIKIKIACFFMSFIVMGAGFIFREYVSSKTHKEQLEAYDSRLSADSSKNLEELYFALRDYDNDLSPAYNIRLYSELSTMSLGHLGINGSGAESLFSFLSAITEITKSETEPNKKLISVFKNYSKSILDRAVPKLAKSKDAFCRKLTDIFSDPTLESALYNEGFSYLAEKKTFQTLGHGMLTEKEALKKAREHLGKNAYLQANAIEGQIKGYCISGKNTSALISSGGSILQLLFDTPEGEASLTEAEAAEQAARFLNDLGFNPEKMTNEGSSNKNGLYVFEYLPIQNGVICESERILVGISKESGRVCLFDGVDYYKNHERNLKLPEEHVTKEEIMTAHNMETEPQIYKIELADGIECLCYRALIYGNEVFFDFSTGEMIMR